MLRKRTVLYFLFITIISACNLTHKPEEDAMQVYRIENFFSTHQIDTLLTDMVTYIGVKPKTATSQNRFDPEFRQYYIQYAAQFKMVYFFINEEGEHYFYLIRPARSVGGNLRGAGGRFKMENEKIYDFEEVFNTPVFGEDRLIETGAVLFLDMINTGNVDQYLGNRQFIEWPDDRLKYHKGLNEWRYDAE
jgi:hypothetical protein